MSIQLLLSRNYGTLTRVAIGLLSFTIYFLCLPGGYSWQNFGVDGGDLLTAAITNGIAHPSGYPLYTHLIRSLIFFFPSNPALVTNVFSALLTVGAGQLLFVQILKGSVKEDENLSISIAALATITFLFAPMVWAHATITEVYPLHVFLLLCLMWLSTREEYGGLGKWGNLWIGIVFGLGMANHLTFAFALPFITPSGKLSSGSVDNWYHRVFQRQAMTVFAFRLLIAIIVSGSLYLSLFLTSLSSPVRWQDPRNLSDLIALVSGRIYHGYLHVPTDFIWQRLLALPGWLVEQIGGFGLFLGMWGIAYTKHNTKWRVSLLFFALCGTIFSVFYPVHDSIVHLFPLLIAFSFWIARGIGQLTRMAKGNPVINVLLVILLLNTGFGVATNWRMVDISNDTSARDTAAQIFNITPENAVLLADNDKEIFTLWYYHDALGERPDLTILAEPLTQMEWYQRIMERVMLPMRISDGQGAASWAAKNPATDFCEIISMEPLEIHCVP